VGVFSGCPVFCDHPSKLMSYVGLTPSEYSSGDHRRLGRLTKAGNSRARRLLIEGAHAYRFYAKVSKEMQARQEGLATMVIDTAWRAQVRLCKRYRYMSQRGKNSNVIKAAIAREMIAFIWSIARYYSNLEKMRFKIPIFVGFSDLHGCWF